MIRTEHPCIAYTWPDQMPSAVVIHRDPDGVSCMRCGWTRRDHPLDAKGNDLPDRPLSWVGFTVWVDWLTEREPDGGIRGQVADVVLSPVTGVPITLVLNSEEGGPQYTVPWTSIAGLSRVRPE